MARLALFAGLSPLLIPGLACLAQPSDGAIDPGQPHDSGPSTSVPPPPTPGGPYCEVSARVFVPVCTACHHPGGLFPDLSFEGAKQGLVGGTSHMYGSAILVAPQDPQGSLLYRKVSHTEPPTEGGVMPPTGMLPAAEVALVEAWIRAGAPTECTDAAPDAGMSASYHPFGFADPAMHGPELKLGLQDCRSCHGAELRGGAGPSCDSCHRAGWRTECTFCHGGTDTMTGAPPRDLDGTTAPDRLSFRAHTAHTTRHLHAAYDCTQCHAKPADVLSLNHVFDATPGRAEVDFTHGLSSAGVYAGAGRCDNLYCHGDAQGTNGSAEHTMPAPDCNGCHAGPNSNAQTAPGMSGQHRRHRSAGFGCTDCHNQVVDASGNLIDPDLHVNGRKDLSFTASGFSFSNGSCNGSCHGENHGHRRW